ncbi:hypothetical protein QAD02_020172 [Eretmocerus hayati]|uniref:Uncharacterized protein n=1 Tax=Eretmocerus hayati TaxID=131215 RepID=A0ACC2PLU6_9HYME|nr:hypothetical protein QAD02_020172 [Eretmocerus hayati]
MQRQQLPGPPKAKLISNPLLSAAQTDFPFSVPESALLMPVTPATPAVLQDDPASLSELQNSSLAESSVPTYQHNENTGSIASVTPISDSTSTSASQQQTPKHQSYFTSILSSLPNLSLSSITGDDTRSSQRGNQANPEYSGSTNSAQFVGQSFHGNQGAPPNIHDTHVHRANDVNHGNFSSPGPQQQHHHHYQQQPHQHQSPPAPPPVTFPPNTGVAKGAGSYRLQSNQRRLKYAPPPDLTSSGRPEHHPSPLPAPPPVAPLRPTGPPFIPSPAQPVQAHRPESEPATPQNTPAEHANYLQAYGAASRPPLHQPQQQHNLFSQANPPQQQQQQHQQVDESSFSPVSAERVSERLENLIKNSADQQNDDALSVKSELSAEVAKITAGISLGGEPIGTNDAATDELTEIDLNASNQQQSSTSSFAVISDAFSGGIPTYSIPLSSASFQKPLQHQQQQQNLEELEVPTVSSFFDAPTPSTQLPAPVAQQVQPHDHYDATDPFSFVQTTSSSTHAASLPGPLVQTSLVSQTTRSDHVDYSWPRTEEPPNAARINADSNAHLTPHSIWEPSQPQHQAPPAHEASVIQPHPTFYNPTQFSNVQQSFPATPPLAVSPHHQLHSTSPSSFNATPEPTKFATLSPVPTVSLPLMSHPPQETIPQSFQNLASNYPEKQMVYRPVYHHWFYRREVESKILWVPFSMHDSLNLEDVHNSNEISPDTKVATDGGRYDVEVLRRQRSPVYWTGVSNEVRRCSWFYKGPAESRYTPYEENVAARLEEEFRQACASNVWNKRVELNNGEYIIFHSFTVQAHYLQATTPELASSWGNNSGSEDSAYLQGVNNRPRVVKRGLDEFDIEDGEPEKIDHLLFLVHGIGSVCDLKFRTVEEVVDEFRSISLQLVQSHYRNSSEQGIVNRIEVLPISWHATLHSGIDKKLQAITLESIPKLRNFTNDTLLDILFYTSPIYCETIMQTVGSEMNRLHALFKERNPQFDGSVYLGGHSLGSLIVFDLLCHQTPLDENEEREVEVNGQTEDGEGISGKPEALSIKPLAAPVLKRKISKKVDYVMGTAGTGQPYIDYPQLSFSPKAFFALGSPIGMFVTVRGIDTLGEDFSLPTCPAFFNIFHPFDPVAYRVESLINPDAYKYRPMLIPHHKGRKRMHLELKETMARVGADLKQRLLESVRNTWNSVYQLAMFHKQDNHFLEQEIEKVVEEQMNQPRVESVHSSTHEDGGNDVRIGRLNGGRRIDYVLQEAPFEYINEYIFALTSHVCYWESEDTMLMILKEIYGSMGVQTDAQLPQQSLSIERVSTPSFSPSTSNVASPTELSGMDPTMPISAKAVGPPPMTGFIRKS